MTKRRCCLHCGVDALSVRSIPDHRRFFKVISIAYYIWPGTYYFQPDNPEHLRCWLTAHTDHRTLKIITVPDNLPAGDFLDKLKDFIVDCAGVDNVTTFGVWRGNTFQKATPLSIDWDTISQKAFNSVRDQVFGLILDVTGVDHETLLVEYGRLPHGTLMSRSPGNRAPHTSD